MNKLTDLLKQASMDYYMGEPMMSDAEFDILAASINFKDVGYSGDNNRATHVYRMYSLQKVFEHEQKNPLKIYTGKLVWTPKLDGAAVSLTYYDGSFTIGLTRGDGKKGIDITNNIRHIVPNKCNYKGLVQITGEVVAPSSIKNARNYAAGALNLKDEIEFQNRDLRFIAYAAQPTTEEYWTDELEVLKLSGFDVITQEEWHKYPTDGLVCRIDNQKAFSDWGYTSHHPKGSYALKRVQKGVETTLVDVVWQLGKSGVVAPVGILDPIEIDGAMISKATLHNIKYIESLQLEIGCRVEVIRSGEIIPRIVRRVW